MQDAIFNSLALTFLVELDNKPLAAWPDPYMLRLWEVAKSVFHLQFAQNEFLIRPREQRMREASEVPRASVSSYKPGLHPTTELAAPRPWCSCFGSLPNVPWLGLFGPFG